MTYTQKNSLLLLAIMTVITHPLYGQEVPRQGIVSITPAEMKSHVAYLASDAMKGRNTPSPELDSCAAYVAREFKSYGLAPVSGSYYQAFNLLKTTLAGANSLSLTVGQTETPYAIKDDFVPLHMTANSRIERKPIVFAGYGITAPEYAYDDYMGIDAHGKVVFIFTGEPQENDSTSVFLGRQNTDYSKLDIKVENAVEHGAVGLLLVSDPTRKFRKPPNPWPSLMKNVPEDAVPFTLDSGAEKRIVCMRIGKDLAEILMDGTGKNLMDLYQAIDREMKPQSFEITGKTITMETELSASRIPTQNVVGFLEGSDPKLKNELLVIGAHYDHVGISGGEIYNGADDNASGTSGVMEVAEAFTESLVKPKRSLLFMAFAGEEKGLFGSSYYADHPLYPLDHTVAMLDLDMISRNDSSAVAIVGSGSSHDLKTINEQCSEKIGLQLLYDSDAFFMQSDHYPFYKKNIPVLFYFSKSTPDLHKPTDDTEKIIPDKMAAVGRLVFSTAWIVANRTARPDFVKFR